MRLIGTCEMDNVSKASEVAVKAQKKEWRRNIIKEARLKQQSYVNYRNCEVRAKEHDFRCK